VWRLNEISVTVRVPIADPDFLKRIEDRGRAENEQSVQWSLRTITSAETSYQAVYGKYACSLAELHRANNQSGVGGTVPGYVIADDLAKGKRGGYIFVISGCDASGYKLVAEPAAPDSGQRAFCSDQSGQLRASEDGKATTCLSSGEKVEGGPGGIAGGVIASGPVLSAPPQNNSAQRIRVSEGVTKGLVTTRVQPVYPGDATKIRGKVVLDATISRTGDVVKLHVVSGHPMLTAAAMNAAKQWKYRPYLLNGKPIEVETQITIDFPPDHN
jgi:TonB family protein